MRRFDSAPEAAVCSKFCSCCGTRRKGAAMLRPYKGKEKEEMAA